MGNLSLRRGVLAVVLVLGYLQEPAGQVTMAAPAAGAAASSGAAGTASATPTVTAPATTPATAATEPTAAPGTAVTTAAHSSPTPQSASASTALQRQLAALPSLPSTGIDVSHRSQTILAHLNAVLRFYRTAVTPAQKVGEPSDVLYAEQSAAEATEVAQLAFEAAKNEALLLQKVAGPNSPAGNAAAAAATAPTESQRLNATLTQAQARLDALNAQGAALQGQIAAARPAEQAALNRQLQQVQGALELQHAMVDALMRVSSFSGAQSSTGLAGNIDRLQRSAPELLSTGAKPPAPGVIQSIANMEGSGVTTQASTLFSLVGTLRTIDQQIAAIDTLSRQADDLRTPFVKVLQATVAQGQSLLQAGTAPAAGSGGTADGTRKQFDTLTATFQVLADAMLPLSQEAVLLNNARGTLTTWRTAVDAEQRSVLRGLLIRLVLIALALGLIAFSSNVAGRLTVKYISDLRRRRQLLFVRRAVVGFLSGLVVLFGFVTQFSSLATFAGFISAGIAVGLQSILLSVAAYFFIVGRYGVRVGDRITVAGVTGDVIEVGLVRFYLMELVGTGTELHSTGRVAVFANSVLFQTGTPLYKQMPGTEYAWHELTAKLKPDAEVPSVTAALLQTVQTVYGGYRERIEAQHGEVERWIGTALPAPEIESRLQLVDGGLQFAVLFPVEIGGAAGADQAVAEAIVKDVEGGGPLKDTLTELPVIKAAVKS